jgi:uncharacterized protein YecE (DUF72 family)
VTTARIGISGWRYPPWRGDFYPRGLPQRRELEYASRHLTSIEINGSFYSLQRPTSYRRWVDQTPDDFVFSLKGGRFITHMKRLSDAERTLPNFFASGLLALGDKLGPVLWQLPPTLPFDPDLVGHFLDQLPRTTAQAALVAARHDDRVPDPLTESAVVRPLRHALEPRHPSFAAPEAVGLLRERGVAMVIADTARTYPVIDEVSADFVYARLHGDEELYASGYSDQALDRWAARVRGWLEAGLDVFVYFDNDVKGYAPHDAMALAERLGIRPAGWTG